MRAAASVLMLVGFHVVAVIQLVAVVLLVIWVGDRTTSGVGLKLGLPLLIAVGATVVGLWRAIRAKPEPAPGLILAERDAPHL